MFSICQNITIFYMIFLFLTKSFAFRHDWPEKLEMKQIIPEALAEIVNTLYVGTFSQRNFNFQVKVLDKNKEHLIEFQKIIDETVPLLNESITVQIRNGIAIPPDNERHNCVLLVDSAESLKFLYKTINEFHLLPEGSYFIVLQTFPNSQHYYDELLDIFHVNWLNEVTNADVLVQAVDNVILLFHSMPFTQFHCKEVVPVIHNKFINGRWLHTSFYTPKTRNLYGCPLVCAVYEEMPYFQINRDQSQDKSKFLGLAGNLLEYLEKNMNFTLEIRVLNERELNQSLHDERGLFKELFETNTDFVMGAYYYKPTTLQDPFAPTTSYYLCKFHFVVANTDVNDSFEKLLLPFEIEIWFALIFIFAFVNIFLFPAVNLNRIIKYFVLGRNNTTPTYNMLVISLGGAVTKDPKVPFSRFLLLLWILSTFILRNVYQGFLFNFIVSESRKSTPKSITEILKDEYRIFMDPITYNSLSNLPELFSKTEILDTSVDDAFEILDPSKDDSFKLTIISTLEFFSYYELTNPEKTEFYAVPEKLFTLPLSLYMKKNSMYLKNFNVNIDNFVSDGLMDRWERLFVRSSNSRKIKDDTPKPIKISNLYATINLLVICLTVSFLTFLAEVLIFEIKRRRLQRNFLKRNKTLATCE